jgi:hypothetical protein
MIFCARPSRFPNSPDKIGLLPGLIFASAGLLGWWHRHRLTWEDCANADTQQRNLAARAVRRRRHADSDPSHCCVAVALGSALDNRTRNMQETPSEAA